MAKNDHQLRVINGLIETTIDSVEGYREAAREVQNNTFRTMFERRASERQAAVAGLQAYVVSQGGKAEDERGKDHIKHKYEDALKDAELAGSARDMVDKAFASVRADLEGLH